MGHHKTSDSKYVMHAKTIHIHSLYTADNRMSNDIAVIELERPIDTTDDQIGIICLPLAHVHEKGSYPALGTQA
jgi:secreted trypsin-like serine protease